MNIRRGFARLYLVLAIVAFGWLNRKDVHEHIDATFRLQGEYRYCVDSLMNTTYRATAPKIPPHIEFDQNGVPVYDAAAYPDFREWQVVARQITDEMAESRARAEAKRPEVESACAAIQRSAASRNLWVEIGKVGLKILALVLLYWLLIWSAMVTRWVYRGFASA